MNARQTRSRRGVELLSCLFVLALFSAASSKAGDGRTFGAIANPLGWADRWGNFSIWFKFDDGIKLGKGELELPVRFQFSSKQRFFADSCLGQGGWMPLLESTVAQDTERDILMTTLGGHFVRLTKFPGSGGQYRSRNRQWYGLLKPGDAFDVRGPEGWRYFFDKGRLRRAETPSGDVLSWRYSDNRVVGLVSRNLGEIVSAGYSDKGLLERLDYNGQDWLQFEYGRYPILTSVLGGAVVTGVVPVLTKIGAADGYEGYVNIVPAESGSDYEFQLLEKGVREPMVVQWHAVSGQITLAEGLKYSAEYKDNSNIYPLLTRREGDSGPEESYYFDVNSLVATRDAMDGRKTSIRYSGLPGASSMAPVELQVSTREDGISWTEKKYYDADGRVLRKISGKRMVKYRYNNDKSVEVTHSLRNGKILLSETFDGQGRLYISEVPENVVYKYDYKKEPGFVWRTKNTFKDRIFCEKLDGFEQVVRREYGDGSSESFEYAGKGQLVKRVDRIGVAWKYVYQDSAVVEEFKDGKLLFKRIIDNDGSEWRATFGDDGAVRKLLNLKSDEVLTGELAAKFYESKIN